MITFILVKILPIPYVNKSKLNKRNLNLCLSTKLKNLEILIVIVDSVSDPDSNWFADPDPGRPTFLQKSKK